MESTLQTAPPEPSLAERPLQGREPPLVQEPLPVQGSQRSTVPSVALLPGCSAFAADPCAPSMVMRT
jgi:hypothetical protein